MEGDLHCNVSGCLIYASLLHEILEPWELPSSKLPLKAVRTRPPLEPDKVEEADGDWQALVDVFEWDTDTDAVEDPHVEEDKLDGQL